DANETATDIEDNVFIHYTSDESLLNQSNTFCFFSYKNCGSCKKIIKTFLKIYPNTPIYFFELENPDNAKLLFEKLYDETFSQLPVLYKTDEDASRKVYSGENEITDFFKGETKSANKNKIRMNAVAIFISGLLDGVNPCAFTVIILLLSYMTLNFRKKSEILVAGIFYVTTVFITYFLVGLGLFEFIKRLEQFALFQMIFKYILSGFLAVLAVVSLFDAIQCARGKREDMLLKLPTVLQKTIRENIRSEMKNYRIFLSSVLLGFLVSLLELACTGQVYLPIVGYMVRSTPLKGLFLLFLYNLGFIIPLAFVFFLVYRNISSKKIGDFFSSHLVAVKILFCLLFVFFFVINIIS
ncbi:MAG: sulfite exporter TauE/SafE family protein, partial [Spirochaetales bacterium]|nr:sulfite exporter TauE/SafE family protein [Spirochaetales bacterium]